MIGIMIIVAIAIGYLEVKFCNLEICTICKAYILTVFYVTVPGTRAILGIFRFLTEKFLSKSRNSACLVIMSDKSFNRNQSVKTVENISKHDYCRRFER